MSIVTDVSACVAVVAACFSIAGAAFSLYDRITERFPYAFVADNGKIRVSNARKKTIQVTAVDIRKPCRSHAGGKDEHGDMAATEITGLRFAVRVSVRAGKDKDVPGNYTLDPTPEVEHGVAIRRISIWNGNEYHIVVT